MRPVGRTPVRWASARPRPATASDVLAPARGGRGVRRPRTSSRAEPASSAPPPPSVPQATSSSEVTFTPARTPAAMPGVPSAFMTTTDQSPSWTFQSSVRVPGPCGRGVPEAARGRRDDARAAGDGALGRVERVEVDVGDDRVRGAAQVALDVAGAGDADEQVLVAARRDADAQVPVAAVAQDGADAVEVDVEVVGGQRGGAGGERFAVGRDVAVGVALGVDPEQAGAGGDEGEGEKGGETAGDDGGDPAAAVARPGRRGGRGHVVWGLR